MRRLAVALCLSSLTIARSATAQVPPAGAPDRSNSQLTLNRDNLGRADAEAARGKARGGDCAGALALFDAALKAGSTDPLVYRDRGICHDRLGNAFPAVEDYRVYLASAANAPDREQVQQRIDYLQPRTTNDKPITNQAPPENLAGQTSRDVYAASREAPERRRSRYAKPGEPVYLFDYYKEQERLDDRADRSPLRFGTGLVIAPFVAVPRIFFLGGHGGVGWAAGAHLRYSVSRSGSVFLEAGWGGIGRIRLNELGDSWLTKLPSPIPTLTRLDYATNESGPIMQLGFELRVRAQGQTRHNDDQYFVRTGAGYERYVDADSRAYVNVITTRFALGFRHVFAEALGFEFGFDGGPVLGVNEDNSVKFGAVVMSTFGLAFGL